MVGIYILPPVWKTIWNLELSPKLKIHLPYKQAIHLLDLYFREILTHEHEESNINMCISL